MSRKLLNPVDDRRLARKICKCIRRDKFHKLKSLVRDIHPDSIINDKGQTGLHLACKLGHPDCLNVFLRSGASRCFQDGKGNLALHHSIKYCLKRPSQENIRDLITRPFMDDLQLLDMPNKKGTKPRALLEALNKFTLAGDDGSDDSSDDGDHESEWQEKLSNANQDDHCDAFGKIIEATFDDYKNEYNETYDQWADRIFSEFRRKRSSPAILKKSEDQKQPPVAQKKLELKLKPEKKLKMVQLNALLDSTDLITASKLPFTEASSPDFILNILLEAEASKEAIRNLIRRWHPDKFSQAFHARIPDDQKEGVMKIVKTVAQALLNYGKLH